MKLELANTIKEKDVEIAGLKNEIAKLKSTIADLNAQIKQLKKDVSERDGIINNLNKDLEVLKTETGANADRLKSQLASKQFKIYCYESATADDEKIKKQINCFVNLYNKGFSDMD